MELDTEHSMPVFGRVNGVDSIYVFGAWAIVRIRPITAKMFLAMLKTFFIVEHGELLLECGHASLEMDLEPATALNRIQGRSFRLLALQIDRFHDALDVLAPELRAFGWIVERDFFSHTYHLHILQGQNLIFHNDIRFFLLFVVQIYG